MKTKWWGAVVIPAAGAVAAVTALVVNGIVYMFTALGYDVRVGAAVVMCLLLLGGSLGGYLVGRKMEE